MVDESEDDDFVPCGPHEDELASPLSAGDAVLEATFVVSAEQSGRRLDVLLASLLPAVSRSRIRRSIDAGQTTVDGQASRAAHRVEEGERLVVAIPPVASGPQPEPIALEVLFEDQWLAVVNKPPGMVVHPAKGHWQGTLAAGLVHRFSTLSAVGGAVRPGIVHRLDRDTSGVIVVAKSDSAHEALARQFQDRTVEKEYLAFVAGRPNWDADRVALPIGPHPAQREKMAVFPVGHPEARPAETFFEVVERYVGFALMRARPKTGRTHQVRLHLAHLRCPVVCDASYGSRSRLTAGELRTIMRRRELPSGASDDAEILSRQALHAHRLSLTHPRSGERVQFEAPLPADLSQFRSLLQFLQQGC